MKPHCIAHCCLRGCLHSGHIPDQNPFVVTKSEVGLSDVHNHQLVSPADPKACTEVFINKNDAYKGHIEA